MDRAHTLENARTFFAALHRELGWRLYAAVGLSILLALTEGAGLLLLIPLLQSIGLTAHDSAAGGIGDAVTRLFAAVGLRPTLASVVAVFLGTTILRALVDRLNIIYQPTLQLRFGEALRRRAFTALVNARWSFFAAQRHADLLHLLFREVDRASSSAYQLLALFTGLAVCGVSVAVAFRIAPLLTFVVAMTGFGALWVIRRRTNRSTQLGRQQGDADRFHFRIASDCLSSLKVAKSFGAEARDVAMFIESGETRSRAHLALTRAFAAGKTGLDVGSAVLMSVLLLVATAWFDLRGTGLLVLIFVFVRVMPRVMSLENSAHNLNAGLPSFAAVTRLIAAAEAHAEPVSAARPVDPLRRELRVEDVSFSYPGTDEPVLREISLSIAAGATTAILGESGAGKSTLADVLTGLLRPSSGRVLIDGEVLADSDAAAWRRSVAYVPQDGFLLHDTIRANLLWAAPAASEAEMWDALARAAAADFVRSRPGGLDTVIGERGTLLSGGERQRLALARALLTNPQVLVLDEATSALDAVSEQQILETVRRLTGRLTAVIITHRFSAIRYADVVHVLEKGRLAESGARAELLARGGVFSRLLAAQSAPALEVDRLQISGRG